MPPDIQVPGQERCGQGVGASGGTLDENRSGDEWLPGLVPPKYGRLRQAEFLCDVLAESPVYELGVFVGHPVPLQCFKYRNDALAAGGADGDEAASGPSIDSALGMEHLGQ